MVNIGPDDWNIRMAQAAVDLPDVNAPTTINADLSVGQEEEVAFFLYTYNGGSCGGWQPLK